ncbi:MAG: hypothetical protein GY855_05980 [candidate division Zixibacteria bacterium]|nr:hypothetical protein [candidate division Zixibacteria bacterium]
MTKSIVGPVINARRMVYGPVEKYGVMFLFARLLDELGFIIEEIVPVGPRVVARREVKEGLERLEAAFAFNSSEARGDGYLDNCEILVCWQDDWGDCPCEVLELRSQVLGSTPARRAIDRVIGTAHTTDVAGMKKPEASDAPESTEEENESEEELHRKFNKTIKEIDDKIKDLF